MVVLEVAAQDATQVLLVEHDHVVQAVSPNGTNQPFDVCILPGRPRGGQHFFDAKVAYTLLKVLAIDSIPVSEKVAWRSLFRESVGATTGSMGGGTGFVSRLQFNHFASLECTWSLPVWRP